MMLLMASLAITALAPYNVYAMDDDALFAPPPPVLIPQAALGLNVPVYDAVTDPVNNGGLGATTIAQQNAIMTDVAAAILAHTANKVARDFAIDATVFANGNHPGYAAALIAAVDAAHPIGPVVNIEPPIRFLLRLL